MSATLERIRLAQDGPSPNFADALGELDAGGKRSHWIWFVLPQLEGLGSSWMSRSYALHDLAEAKLYLRDEMLRSRFVAVARIVANRLGGPASLERLMGSRTDALKAVSSFTLFEAAAHELVALVEPEHPRGDCLLLTDIAARILARAEGEGFARCAFTLEKLSADLDATLHIRR